jgi:hypothetical protein
MSGNNLITTSQIAKLKSSLNGCEMYETIQTYDENADVVYTPLYADLDGPTATKDCIEICEMIIEEFDIVPNIYFSGSKGFHLIIPVKVMNNADCFSHVLCKHFFNRLGQWASFDDKVYTSRRLLRSCGSIHHKTGHYKTRITLDEIQILGSDVRSLCTKPLYEDDYEWINNELINNVLNDISISVKSKNANRPVKSSNHSSGIEFSNCMRLAITNIPRDGDWNHTLVTIARFFNNQKIDKRLAINILFKFSHWLGDSKHVEMVFRSVYRRDSYYTCRGNETLERNCDMWCMFNPKVDFL